MRGEVALSYTDIRPAEMAESVECLDRAGWTRGGTGSWRPAGDGGKQGEVELLPLGESSPGDATRVRPCRPQELRGEAAASQDLPGGMCVSRAGTGQPGKSCALPGVSLSFPPWNEPVSRELSWHRSFSPCGTLCSQSAAHFATVREKA